VFFWQDVVGCRGRAGCGTRLYGQNPSLLQSPHRLLVPSCRPRRSSALTTLDLIFCATRRYLVLKARPSIDRPKSLMMAYLQHLQALVASYSVAGGRRLAVQQAACCRALHSSSSASLPDVLIPPLGRGDDAEDYAHACGAITSWTCLVRQAFCPGS
jgi:hypothetical protein